MKYFLTILLIAIIVGLGIGHYLKTEDPETGNLIIGLSISTLFFAEKLISVKICSSNEIFLPLSKLIIVVLFNE